MTDITVCGEAVNITSFDNCKYDIVNQLFDYPLFDVTTSTNTDITPKHTIERNIHFLIGHCGFFLFNFINCWVIVLIHGFVLGRFKKNKLMKYAFAACFCQLTSCTFSIYRYNINDEYGDNTSLAHWSNVTGIVAFMPFNYVSCRIFINHESTRRLLSVSTITLVGFGIFIFVFGDFVRWKQDDFKWIRIYFAMSTLFQLSAYIKASWAFCRREIRLPGDFPVPDEMVNRVLLICIILTVMALFFAGTKMPVLQYPATGMTFSVMLVAVSLFGEMDFLSGNDGSLGRRPNQRIANEDSLLLLDDQNGT